jgi:hypothetical protein
MKQQIWKGKTEYFDEIVDSFLSAGIKVDVDYKKHIIAVEEKDYDQAYGILMELNQALEAGW